MSRFSSMSAVHLHLCYKFRSTCQNFWPINDLKNELGAYIDEVKIIMNDILFKGKSITMLLRWNIQLLFFYQRLTTTIANDFSLTMQAFKRF